MSYHKTVMSAEVAHAGAGSVRAAERRARRALKLLPLYAASAVLMLGEGSFQLSGAALHARERPLRGPHRAVFSVYGIAALASRIPPGAPTARGAPGPRHGRDGALVARVRSGRRRRTDPVLLSILVGLDGPGSPSPCTATWPRSSSAVRTERTPARSWAGTRGAIGLGYGAAGFLGGAVGDALGPSRAILALALLPLLAGAVLTMRGASHNPVQRCRRGPSAPALVARLPRSLGPRVGRVLRHPLHQPGQRRRPDVPPHLRPRDRAVADPGRCAPGSPRHDRRAIRFFSGVVLPLRLLPAHAQSWSSSRDCRRRHRERPTFLALAVACAVLGLGRGCSRRLRALVMDEAAARRPASSVYLAGLDLGQGGRPDRRRPRRRRHRSGDFLGARNIVLPPVYFIPPTPTAKALDSAHGGQSDLFEPITVARASSAIAEQIRTAIVTGRIREGERLSPERELAEQFGVSRVTVRDALRSLEAMGLIEVRVGARGGAFVTAPTGSKVAQTMSRHDDDVGRSSPEDIVEARLIVELGTVTLAVRAGHGRRLDEASRARRARHASARGRDLHPRALVGVPLAPGARRPQRRFDGLTQSFRSSALDAPPARDGRRHHACRRSRSTCGSVEALERATATQRVTRWPQHLLRGTNLEEIGSSLAARRARVRQASKRRAR